MNKRIITNIEKYRSNIGIELIMYSRIAVKLRNEMEDKIFGMV